ncbi:tRNA glutamyl-Q(34) synthetase GluQRS [Rhodophyticola sp. CCM32]|uniref:tRNA glutamyl-Q(34) synthetase GluQRS n=1 Tax=Rhodophyticola sp. CCM32 TaxID=2916397 RepID=UPI00107EF4B3|nr:tRNA glutamyl-Q(34) synthetase GluQRS [Rhodophyticola sp. CCM32]QBY00450.1 tRNA glutamyl-Q(34) synthetase GluQRS [Rhodophyticola sp. CCM32]
MTFTTRFAPSPTGPLHLGHAYSALLAQGLARRNEGRFLLRIEDIDRSRARPEWEAQIFDDLAWLGLCWPEPVLRQSSRMGAYHSALRHLHTLGLVYPCHCNRADIRAALDAPQEGAKLPTGPDGLVYPGTCRLPPDQARATPMADQAALRLNIRAALAHLGDPVLSYEETGDSLPSGQIRISPEMLIHQLGDIILARRDIGTSYHLSVVLDDAEQQITHVIRGADLSAATAIHVLLQDLLQLPRPIYHHHRLIRDAAGKRLAKRDDARAIATYRAEGASPQDIRSELGL